MKYLRKFNENVDDLEIDLDGLLINVKDFNDDIQTKIDDGNVGGRDYKTVMFYSSDADESFNIKKIYDDVKTVEDYLISKEYTFVYVCEYYLDDERTSMESIKSISEIKNRDLRIRYLHITIYKK